MNAYKDNGVDFCDNFGDLFLSQSYSGAEGLLDFGGCVISAP